MKELHNLWCLFGRKFHNYHILSVFVNIFFFVALGRHKSNKSILHSVALVHNDRNWPISLLKLTVTIWSYDLEIKSWM